MATKRITQETFDAVVKENIDDFEMDAEEAVEDAIKQFESQGVNLSNIIKQAATASDDQQSGSEARHPILTALQRIQDSLNNQLQEKNDEKLQDACKLFQEQSCQGAAYRNVAAANGAYSIMYKLCQSVINNPSSLSIALRTMASLIDGQPDLMDNVGIQLIMEILKMHFNDSLIQQTGINVVRLACIMHESNRQKFVSCDLIEHLISVLRHFTAQIAVIKEACSTLRTLTLDDDIRVPFGKAHEHAKMIASECNGLELLIEVIKLHYQDTTIYCEICSTIAKLAVRNEYCQQVVDLGGLKLVTQALAERMDESMIAARSCFLLRAISGNDDVKIAIVNSSCVSLIIAAMDRHPKHMHIAEQACAVFASLALRHPQHCAEIISCGGADFILKAMKIHEDVESVQKQGCLAIRNIVARSREYCNTFLEAGAEAIIRQARRKHKSCDDEAKAALRDLECAVQLKELWTGLPTNG
ncbi:Armadillo repeat-containing protein 6 [Trichoplax sp. H2]|uniref:Armadillo repeat-containing protein 6 n=1 Tax=Trichoplax adhaerens TaxID=10228 RepID=B3RSW5_TRIAD|nr:hypothetical protein TRIADDRAFT_54752 [Trichoplax adhaerens]EDV26595.1 hypothetical protein TRIADDRAFT_54752 [Trichoplax adhaerens]RDD45765.1 Armadillo repeat-containing protein 6 [Trichoplax sp. H2]|eukprot:XP_002110591.1 hypothetical protein TRIADDRAFT_54752 [Trichoplax adhaerens]